MGYVFVGSESCLLFEISEKGGAGVESAPFGKSCQRVPCKLAGVDKPLEFHDAELVDVVVVAAVQMLAEQVGERLRGNARRYGQIGEFEVGADIRLLRLHDRFESGQQPLFFDIVERRVFVFFVGRRQKCTVLDDDFSPSDAYADFLGRYIYNNECADEYDEKNNHQFAVAGQGDIYRNGRLRKIFIRALHDEFLHSPRGRIVSNVALARYRFPFAAAATFEFDHERRNLRRRVAQIGNAESERARPLFQYDFFPFAGGKRQPDGFPVDANVGDGHGIGAGRLVRVAGVETQQPLRIAEPDATLLVFYRFAQRECGARYAVGEIVRRARPAAVETVKPVVRGYPQPVLLVFDDALPVFIDQRRVRRQIMPEIVHRKIGNVNAAPVGNEIELMPGILVNGTDFFLVEEILGEYVVADSSGGRVPDTYAGLGAYPALSFGIEKYFIHISLRQLRVGTGIRGELLVAVPVKSGVAAYPQTSGGIGADTENLPLRQFFGFGQEGAKLHFAVVESVHAASIGADVVFALVVKYGKYHLGIERLPVEKLYVPRRVVGKQQPFSGADELLGAVYGDCPHLHARRRLMGGKDVVLIETIVETLLIKAYPQKIVAIDKQGVNGIGSQLGIAFGRVPERTDNPFLVRRYHMHAVAVGAHIEQAFSVGRQRRHDVAPHIYGTPELSRRRLELHQPHSRCAQINRIADARDGRKSRVVVIRFDFAAL